VAIDRERWQVVAPKMLERTEPAGLGGVAAGARVREVNAATVDDLDEGYDATMSCTAMHSLR
jgi:hypothetical protein